MSKYVLREGGVGERRVETHLTQAFEYVNQNLASYLEHCPNSPGLSDWKIKVCIIMSNYLVREGGRSGGKEGRDTGI